MKRRDVYIPIKSNARSKEFLSPRQSHRPCASCLAPSAERSIAASNPTWKLRTSGKTGRCGKRIACASHPIHPDRYLVARAARWRAAWTRSSTWSSGSRVWPERSNQSALAGPANLRFCRRASVRRWFRLKGRKRADAVAEFVRSNTLRR